MAVPAWIVEFQAFSGTIVTISAVIVAIAGWRVASRQAIAARQKLRLDLYPHRLKVYQAAHLAVVSAINFSSESVIFDQSTTEFRDVLREARFLFGADAFDYLENLLTSVLQYRHVETQSRNDSGYYVRENMAGFRERHDSNEKFILSRLQGLHQKLGSYLRVEEGLTTSQTIFQNSFLNEILTHTRPSPSP